MPRTATLSHAKRSFCARVAASAALILCACSAHAACGRDQYFAPQDVSQQSPLARPHADFETIRRFASSGVAAEERNLAALYDSGYLVSMCHEKALYWYARAAEHGDEYAQEWLERHAAMERLRNGPECFGDACTATASGPRKTVLLSRPNGMFHTNVIINGKTRQGMIDTGATYVVMSSKVAQELGVSYSGGQALRAKTANGIVQARAVKLETMTIGGITLKDVDAAVQENDVELLVGMSFLRRLNVTTSGGAMTLIKP